ncbi:MAG: PQQ-dependent dehydrogenase, methanol/ethanol family [Acidimicrobiales bacterium]|nr:PQQ-dependent dehydrogenase, methanol/ethanol family [Hyphomonadaceae bacterium]RZV41546.1 MAG: PQQ-dependent dehydrogenase, methanol/ethanol family [Acidimicrobiales bacterium]
MKNITILALAAAFSFGACQAPDTKSETRAEPETKTAMVTDADLANAENTPAEWLTYGGTYEEQRYSTLNKITKDNIKNLGIAWTFDLSTSRGVEATPIVVDGVMYVTGAWSIVHALDARTGEELWTYDPEVSGEDAIKGCCDVVNRGVAVYDGKVYIGVFDGRLEALDAKTGKVAWSTVTVDQSKPYTITMAPRIVKGKVLIGNSGAELGVRGYISAYDAQTGEKVWRFYTVPNPEKKPDGEASDKILADLANNTWGDTGAWTTDGGGGTVWDSVIYDDVNDSVIIGVGNASPWNAKIRDPESNGDNLFLSSILALDADTGTYKWHFQTTPRDQWDYTATQHIIIAELPLGDDGGNRRVVMQAPKNGFFYVLDAADGEFISGDAFVPMNWATGLDENGRPIEAPNARDTAGDGVMLFPGPHGAHNWHPMAFSQQTGLVYIPAQVVPQIFQDEVIPSDPDAYWNLGYNLAAGIPPAYPAGTIDALRKGNQGFLLAWDPVAQKAAWTVPHDGPWNGGVLATSGGLVFQGTIKGDVVAYDAASGEKLWSKSVNSGALSGISTYELDGDQYVAMTTGWGTSFALSAGYEFVSPVAPDVGHVISFKLGGTTDAPDGMAAMDDRTPKGDAFGTPEMVSEGLLHYSQNCLTCHGPLAISSGVTPDLRWSYVTGDKHEWEDILMNGALKDNGMVSFKEQISVEQAEMIRAYVLAQAHMAVANGEAGPAEE